MLGADGVDMRPTYQETGHTELCPAHPSVCCTRWSIRRSAHLSSAPIVQRPPDPLRRERCLEVADPEMAQRVDDGVVDGRDRPDRAGLPDALGAEGVDERRCLHRHEVERRQVGRRDHGIVGEVGGPRLAVAVVVHRFEQCLGDALGDAAVHLAFRQQRVDERAGVVDGDVLAQPHRTRLCVDLDDGDVGAERKRRHRGLEDVLDDEVAVGAIGEVVPAEAGRRRAGDVEAAVVQHDVADVRLEAVRSPLPGGVDELGGRRGEGGAGELHRPRPDGQPAGGNGIGVAVDDLDLVDRHAGGVGHDHRPRRVVALPVRRRPAADQQATAVDELDCSELRARQRRR